MKVNFRVVIVAAAVAITIPQRPAYCEDSPVVSVDQAKLLELKKAIDDEERARGGSPAPAGDVTSGGPERSVGERDAVPSSPPTVVSGDDGRRVEIPAVPAGVMAPSEGGAAENTEAMTQPAVITIRPGTTELVAVAEGHLNRIVTPFSEPAVVTTSDAKYKVSGNVVYVSTTSPATIYITPKGDEAVAVPLALIPRRIPPREITLQMPKGAVWRTSTIANAKASSWEQTQPYVKTMLDLARDMALGKLPPGYSIRDAEPDDGARCGGPAGLAFNFLTGQTVEGARLRVVIGTVVNNTATTVNLDETWCVGPNTAAVAFWPEIALTPGGMSEVYVIVKPVAVADEDSRRPSLLSGRAR